MKHSTTPQTRRGRGPARRIGRSLALVLPVVLVLSGTLAVARVNWSGAPSSPVLTAADTSASGASSRAGARAPQDVLRDKLLVQLQKENPGVALTHLQQAVNDRPSLAKHCASIARSLGRAAVRVYGPTKAQSYARPVCDTSFAAGVVTANS
ncbi:membrane protein [Streptomyces malachitofuscus]|nr:membrane protein [Streptomyces malachitofuscus]